MCNAGVGCELGYACVFLLVRYGNVHVCACLFVGDQCDSQSRHKPIMFYMCMDKWPSIMPGCYMCVLCRKV